MRWKPAILILITAAIVLLVAIVIMPSRQQTATFIMPDNIPSALAVPVNFVKNRLTGGIGANLSMDSSGKLPKVIVVNRGSPAEKAGMLAGDTIIKVNDFATIGQPLAQVIAAIHGFPGGHVAITVQRVGSTNLTFDIKRNSWSAMGLANNYSTSVSSGFYKISPVSLSQPPRSAVTPGFFTNAATYQLFQVEPGQKRDTNLNLWFPASPGQTNRVHSFGRTTGIRS